MVVSCGSIRKLLIVRPGEHCEIAHGIGEYAFSPDIAAAAEGAEEVAKGAVLRISGWICRRHVRQTMRGGDDITRSLIRNDETSAVADLNHGSFQRFTIPLARWRARLDRSLQPARIGSDRGQHGDIQWRPPRPRSGLPSSFKPLPRAGLQMEGVKDG